MYLQYIIYYEQNNLPTFCKILLDTNGATIDDQIDSKSHNNYILR